jgi:hypothetical protein
VQAFCARVFSSRTWEKKIQFAEYAPYMNLLERLLMANPTLYQEFIMVSTKTEDKPGESEYYVGVPHKALYVAEF